MERARSALNIAHHQFEYEPPGELAVIIKGIPYKGLSLKNARQHANPNKGRTRN